MAAAPENQLRYRPGYAPRRHPRVPIQLAVRYRPSFVSQWVRGKSVNLSLSGLFIAAEVLPMQGTEINVEILRKDEVFVRATGVVRWARADPSVTGEPRGFGLELVAASEMTQARLSELIEAHHSGALDLAEERARDAQQAAKWRKIAIAVAAAAIVAVGAVIFFAR